MKVLYLDLETRSLADLKTVGADVYARDPSTEILCVGAAFFDEPVDCVSPDSPDEAQAHILYQILGWVELGGTVVCHNAAFELAIWNTVGVGKYGWPPLPPDQVICTMAMSYAMALPGALADAASAVGSINKAAAGHRIMLQLSQPRDREAGTWWTPEEHPEKFAALFSYCKQDIEVTRALCGRLMQLSPSERDLWLLDRTINDRGVKVALPLVATAIKVIGEERWKHNARMVTLTQGAVMSVTATGQIVDFLAVNGVETDSIAKSKVIELLARDDLPFICREVLLLRQESGRSSVAKLEAMTNGACKEDSRLRGMFQYYGAGATGRFAGRRVQLHNLPRPTIAQAEIESILSFLESNAHARDAITLMHGSPIAAISNCLRAFLVAEEGCEFLAADLSAIESRVLNWLAGEDRVLAMYRSHGKIYEANAATIYGVSIDAVTKDQRQIGKIAELALGFQGGTMALRNMAKNHGVSVSHYEGEKIKIAWRQSHPNVVRFWKTLEEAAIQAVLHPQVTVHAGKIRYRKDGSFLWCQLPSERVICYPYPKLRLVIVPWGGVKQALTYMGKDAVGGKWNLQAAYGGLLCENVVQATARDILVEGMFKVEAAGYPIVMHVHDEIVCEVPKGFGSVDEMSRLMVQMPPWAEGLPLAASGWRGSRYRK